MEKTERVKLEAEISPDLLRGLKERSQREGKDSDAIVEEALSRYLRSELLSLVDRVSERSGLTEEEAMRLANGELEASRTGR